MLFHVAADAGLRQLSSRSLDEMIAGARVEVAPYKKDPMDFVLWKPSKPDEPGWDSPWGRGRPGWHIECSAMSATLSARPSTSTAAASTSSFRITRTKSRNRAAPSTRQSMANYWMHNGFLQVEGEKMAKSAGNFVTISELLSSSRFGGRSWDGATLRFAMLRTQHRQPIDWTVRGLEECEQALRNWANLLARHQTSFTSEEVPPVALS